MTATEIRRIEVEAIGKGNWKPVEEAVKAGKAIDLIRHGSARFKRILLEHINTEELAYDPDINVRKAMAYAGYELDILVHDPDPRVRVAVAYKGYGLDQFVNDPVWTVRRAVANMSNHYLDILANDESVEVRRTSAGRSTGKRFLKDENAEVRAAARHRQYLYNREYGCYDAPVYKYHDPIETRQDYISSYNYDGYSEDYYDYN